MPHKARELVLHVGLAKTGSSAIQRALLLHKQALYEKGHVLFPGDLDNHLLLQAAFSSDPASHFRVQMLGLDDTKAALAYLRRYRRQIVAEIDEKRPRRIIMSSEYFSAMSVEELRSLRSFLDSLAKRLVLVLYVRDPWTHALSTIQEFVRAGWLTNEVELGYVKSNVEIIAKFEKAFDSRIVVAPYVSSAKQFNVVDDFCRRAGIPPDLIDSTAFRNINVSLRRETAIALLQLFRYFPNFDRTGKYVADPARDWMVEALQGSTISQTPIQLSKATAERIYHESKADLTQLQYRYLGGSSVLSDQYELVQTIDADDKLSPEAEEPARIYAYAISCMRSLSEKALHQFIERVYWTGKYHRANGDIGAAIACFEEVLGISRDHGRISDALAELDVLRPQAPEQMEHRPAR